MNETPAANRIQIGIFGRRNAGKSSLINAITGQDLAVVSDIKGTTTDPVKKAMELLPIGPVVLIDTPGLDDEGDLGEKRIKKAKEMLRRIDILLLVIDGKEIFSKENDFALEKKLLSSVHDIPVLLVINKADKIAMRIEEAEHLLATSLNISQENILSVSATQKMHIHALKEKIPKVLTDEEEEKYLIKDLLSEGDIIILVVPIDESAPKGRLILPQQQVIRDALEANAMPIVCKETQVKQTIAALKKKPRMVITDSQAFDIVSKDTPKEIPLTSFSILMSRYKGNLLTQIKGAKALENLKDKDVVLISEGCTHHRQCNDIGTVKLPRKITEYTKKNLQFEFTSGGEFPDDIKKYALVIHCGGCMLRPKEMRYRISHGEKDGVAITNYGVVIAYMQGILDRVTESVV